MLNRRVPRPSTGVTLIELVVAIAILVIVLAAGLPSFSTWIQNARTRTEAESILRGLQLARQEAISRNARVAFNLVAGGRDWSVDCETPTATCPTGIKVRQASGESGVVINSGGQLTYVFNNMGVLRVPAIAAGTVFTTIDVTNSLLSGPDGRNLRIMITSGGMIRMCDPLVTDSTDLRFCSV